MAERDLIEQLDQAVDAMLGSRQISAGPEVTELAGIANWLRDLPPEDFRASLRSELASAIRDLEKEKNTMTAAPASGIRPGFRTLTPYLHVTSAAAQIEFLKTVFGAQELGRYPAPDGSRIMHAEVRLGDSIIEMGEMPQPNPTPLHVYVPDVDAVYQRALEAGAHSSYPPTDHEYGERGAGVRDPEGNRWYIATAKGEHYAPRDLHHSVNIYLSPKGAPALIDFMKHAFGAEELARHEAGGRVAHAMLRFGDSIIEMGEAHGEHQPIPCAIHYYVPDADEAYRRAMAAGAVSISPPADQPYGERNGAVKDPHGNTWFLATHSGRGPAV